MDERRKGGDEVGRAAPDQSGNRKMAHETQREFLIRTGKITPFSKVGGNSARSGAPLRDAMLDAEESEGEVESDSQLATDEPLSHQHLRQPGFLQEAASDASGVDTPDGPRPKRRRLVKRPVADYTSRSSPGRSLDDDDDSYAPGHAAAVDDVEEASSLAEDSQGSPQALSPWQGEDDEAESEDEQMPIQAGRRRRAALPRKGAKKSNQDLPVEQDLEGVDDGDEKLYQARLMDWIKKRRHARTKALNNGESAASERDSHDNGTGPADGDEWLMPHPTRPDTVLEGGLRLPGDIYPSLFDYQKTGVQWLWELYQQRVGGVIGDEMGLGKTIQVISFLAGLHHSNQLTKPVLIVTPATVMKQWVNEFHRWWPPLRVCILHTSGSGMLNVRGEDRMEREIEEHLGRRPVKGGLGRKKAQRIVGKVLKEGHVLVTTYAGLQSYGDLLIPAIWGYAVLDEGHKIRNPNTAITIYCKEIRTPNRVILSGTPMQNNLTELWSLFDFIFPMRLGTLVTFRTQFEIPIRIGGYANASNLQVQTAMKCAETLKDAISPYLLQRLKIDVASDLPKKSEQVLFCRLTKFQRQAYEAYLRSPDIQSITEGTLKTFAGIETLRKICNHPDLLDRHLLLHKADYDYGRPSKSGKMKVVGTLLDLWKQDGHKTLLFAQQRIMLDILEKFIKSSGRFTYRRMDGNTPIEQRQSLVDEFNGDSKIDVFLLTTKVGGLGVNLTGANRVIIYDPDWNPSTDSQARERAWRLGQTREVTIYRLMTAGTIEEKIYHRQLFKQFLANKILKDPKQRQTLPMNDLQNLFTLAPEDEVETETGQLFQGTETRFAQAVNGKDKMQGRDANGTSLAGSSRGPPLPAPNIAGVASIEDLVDPNESHANGAGEGSRIVEGILAGSGVSSALKHDEIVNGKRIIQGDQQMIEREAKRIAAEAAKELKRAGQLALEVPIGTPTWTGEVGVAGRPTLPFGGLTRGGPSSASILAGLQSRLPGSPSGNPVGDGRAGRPTGMDFLTKIRDYLVTHGGEVRSQMLVDHFGRMCQTAQQTSEFKEMLRQIATLEKAGPMRGKWVLKEEYRR